MESALTGLPVGGALRLSSGPLRRRRAPTGVDPIYWNTVRLGEAVRQRKRARLPVEPELLAHISPLGWAHILLTGEYRWPRTAPEILRVSFSTHP